MKPSRFNCIVGDNATGQTVLFNTLYGSMALVDIDEANEVYDILDGSRKPNAEMLDALSRQEFLISDDRNEISIVEERKRRGIADPNRIDIIIMPTLDCNFACTYCYETRRPDWMTDQTESRLMQWLGSEIPKFKLVMLHWFGGEPLLAADRILSISRRVAAIGRFSDTLVVMHVTTNGYLLSRERAANLVAAGIFSYQVTVDGPSDTHDKLRMLRNGSATFDRILENITALAVVSSFVCKSVLIPSVV